MLFDARLNDGRKNSSISERKAITQTDSCCIYMAIIARNIFCIFFHFRRGRERFAKLKRLIVCFWSQRPQMMNLVRRLVIARISYLFYLAAVRLLSWIYTVWQPAALTSRRERTVPELTAVETADRARRQTRKVRSLVKQETRDQARRVSANSILSLILHGFFGPCVYRSAFVTFRW